MTSGIAGVDGNDKRNIPTQWQHSFNLRTNRRRKPRSSVNWPGFGSRKELAAGRKLVMRAALEAHNTL